MRLATRKHTESDSIAIAAYIAKNPIKRFADNARAINPHAAQTIATNRPIVYCLHDPIESYFASPI